MSLSMVFYIYMEAGMFADMDEVKCKQGCFGFGFGFGVALLLHCFIRL